LRGLVAELAARGFKVDYRSVWNFVHAKKLSFKKIVVASERDRPDVARRRTQCTKRQSVIDPKRLVFIDETRTAFPAGLRADADSLPKCRTVTGDRDLPGALRNDHIAAPCL
jgi:hypothetical protein